MTLRREFISIEIKYRSQTTEGLTNTHIRIGASLHNGQRINLKSMQATPAAQLQKNKWPNKKLGQRTKQTSLQRRHTDG